MKLKAVRSCVHFTLGIEVGENVELCVTSIFVCRIRGVLDEDSKSNFGIC